MAPLAGHNGMQSDQWKARQIMVEGDLLAPARLPVTLPAIGAQLAMVSIVLAMASNAGHRQLVAIKVARVAALAGDGRVTAAQRKPGRLVVVEADGRPLHRRVAGLTAIAVPSRVLVLQAVAGDAGSRQILVALTDMAFRTCNLAVRAHQGELRLGVIVGLYLTPGFLPVTTLARRAESSLVRVIILVAVEAASGRLAVLLALHMTAVAADPLVRPCQHEICERMIERLAIELDDIERASLVIRVTGPAVGS